MREDIVWVVSILLPPRLFQDLVDIVASSVIDVKKVSAFFWNVFQRSDRSGSQRTMFSDCMPMSTGTRISSVSSEQPRRGLLANQPADSDTESANQSHQPGPMSLCRYDPCHASGTSFSTLQSRLQMDMPLETLVSPGLRRFSKDLLRRVGTGCTCFLLIA